AIASLALTDLGSPTLLLHAPPGATVRENPRCVALSPDQRCIAWARDDGTVSIRNVATGEEIASTLSISRTIFGLAWSPNSEMLAI
ncbi:MAG: hypothetical protein V4710_22920, partial [Verrucomicrobiota bacterium]